ncbi:MAG: DUF6291 domain-containing protein [Clostridiales bacterium]|uniref:DUF6291 domain-containing protein n=1 Tax=Terrisporobacter sp. TaxID=1965305 RepID=UPI002A4FCB3D|nr:DUF6291 domain-containing protein [Terrisporobacter sp.]MDD7756198.1 DUF6291 domain-containing protein [Clostridiales bacterium]MDY4136599.1 DUF6291 domain-containing protein [Terrisporobacter sp.]
MASKKGFLLLNNQYEVIETLNDEQAGQLLKAFFDYNLGKEIKLNGLMRTVFNNFKVVFDENEQKYQEKCEKNKQNIENYWKKIKEQNNTNEYECIQSNTNVYEKIRTNTMATNINKNININTNTNINKNINTNKLNNNININKSERDQSFTPTASPTLAEIYNYACTLDINDKDYCEKFYNHYESIGWVNGTGREIKNWKLVFNNWLKKDNKQNDRREINQECNLQ